MKHHTIIYDGGNRSWIRWLSVILSMASLLMPAATSIASVSSSRGKTLIINSDVSVPHYLQVQSIYIAKSGSQHIDRDMGGKTWVDDSELKDLILDEAPDVIYCIGSKAYRLTQSIAAATDTNIIFSSIINWRRFQLDRHTHGIANELNVGMALMTYRFIFPEIKNIGVLYSKKYNKEWLARAEMRAGEVGMHLVPVAVTSSADVVRHLDALLSQVDALWLISDPIVLSKMASVIQIFKHSQKMQKPVFAYSRAFAKYGATLTVSTDIPTIGGQVALLGRNVIQGKHIATQVQDPAGSYVILNMRKVDEYGVQLNERAMASVNDIIRSSGIIAP